MVGLRNVQIAVAVIFRVERQFFRRCLCYGCRKGHDCFLFRLQADLRDCCPDTGAVLRKGGTVDPSDLEAREVPADPVVEFIGHVHGQRQVARVGDVYVICHGIAAVETMHSALTLFRGIAGPGLIHGVGGIFLASLWFLHRGVCGVFLITQFIRVVFLGHGLFGNCVTLAVAIVVFPTVFLIGTSHVRGTGGVQVSKAIINGVSGEEFFRCVKHVGLIADDRIASDCQLKFHLVAFHADDTAHGGAFTAVLIIKSYGCRLRRAKVVGNLEVIRHGHSQVGLSGIGHGHVIQYLVSAEETVLASPGFRRCQ